MKPLLIIDTETTLSKEVFDIGWLVCDRNENIYTTKQFIVQENLTKTFFFEEKRPLYNSRIENLLIRVAPKEEILKELMNDIEEYNPRLFAYNSPFDERVLNKLWGTEIEIEDIFPYAFNIAKQKSYLRENRRTQNGNMSMNAENVYQYISNNNEFEEEHTALNDCYVEMAILLKALRQHKKVDKTINCSNAWKILNELYEELGN